MSDRDTGNLRLLPVARDDDAIVQTKDKPKGHEFCRHARGEIDEDAHRLYCRECGEEIDPLNFLLRLTKDREHWRREAETLGSKRHLAARQLEDVERKLKNAKARLRKTGVRIEVPAARAARRQLKALQAALITVLDDREEAKRTAHLHGVREDELAKAHAALTEALREVGGITRWE